MNRVTYLLHFHKHVTSGGNKLGFIWVEGGGNFTHTGLKNTPTPTTYYYRVVDI